MLLSIKTGGCPEDCAYCPQSAHYKTDVDATDLVDARRDDARRPTRAREQGATRFCMGAAWRDVPDGPAVRARARRWCAASAASGMEACCTLGMLTQEQADALADAGLTAYNHNLDTSPEFYGSIITTRTYDERLATLARVRQAGITVCCGGIIGMGEDRRVRYRPAAAAGRARSASGERARSTCWSASTGTPLADLPAGRSARAGAHDRDRAHPDARVDRAPQRRAAVADRRSAGALLPGRRQLGLPRRPAADDAESRAPTHDRAAARTSSGMRLHEHVAADCRSRQTTRDPRT